MTGITNGGRGVRFMRAYSAVFSITLLVTTLPTGVSGVLHARTISDATYSNRIGVDERLWLLVGGFVLGIALAQTLYTRARKGRLRAYEHAVAVFLGLWVGMGVSFALATAEWSGLGLVLLSSTLAPVMPWTETGASFRRRTFLTLLALAAVASASASSAQYFDSGFLFLLFAVPMAAAGGAIGVLGAEHIVEREHRWTAEDEAREDALRQLTSDGRHVA